MLKTIQNYRGNGTHNVKSKLNSVDEYYNRQNFQQTLTCSLLLGSLQNQIDPKSFEEQQKLLER